MFNRAVILLCALFLSTPAFAETPEAVMPEMVATASRWEEPAENVPQSMAVISHAEIEKKGVPFVVDLLRLQPDLQVVQNGGPGSLATLLMRGGGSNQVLVLVDGFKINSPSTGSADLSGLLTYDVERIEIIKGPQSTLYGSEAMAGVVNIITRKGAAAKLKADLSVEGGSFSTVKTAGTVSGSTDRLNYRLGATYLDTEGFSIANSGTEPNSYNNKSVSARLGANPTGNSAVELNLRYGKDKAQLDDYAFGVGPVDSENFLQDRENYLVAVTAKIFPWESYEQSLSLSFFQDDLETTDPVVSFNNYRVKNKTKILDWQHTFDLKPLTFTGGFAYRHEETDNEGAFSESINNKAVYLNAKLALLKEALIVDAGVRYDDHSTFGDEVTYRTGVLYHLRPLAMRFKANFGTGFRAPSLNELYYPFYGNPDLRPERSTGYDVSLEKDLLDKKLVLGGTWFSQHYRNLIQTNFATFTADNIGRAQTDGVELTARAQLLDNLRVNAAYAWLDAVNEDTGAFLPLRPRNKFTSSLDYTMAKLTVIGEYQYVSRRFDSSMQRDISPYAIVNLKGSYALHKNLAIFARIDNLFDKSYEESAGYGTPGLSAYGGIRMTY